MKNHLFEDKSGVIHSCHLSTIGRDTNLVWTDCLKDVPANASWYGHEQANCEKCAGEIWKEKISRITKGML